MILESFERRDQYVIKINVNSFHFLTRKETMCPDGGYRTRVSASAALRTAADGSDRWQPLRSPAAGGGRLPESADAVAWRTQ